jgi:RHS repeat-associated protein
VGCSTDAAWQHRARIDAAGVRSIYNYFRDYDPAKGGYAESDPIGLLGGVNTYAYVRNAVMRFIDPFGLSGADVVTIWNVFHQTSLVH